MAEEKTLAQLAAEQDFNEFENRFKFLVDHHISENVEFQELSSEMQRYQDMIKHLEACECN